jgi:hypothetical protein
MFSYDRTVAATAITVLTTTIDTHHHHHHHQQQQQHYHGHQIHSTINVITAYSRATITVNKITSIAIIATITIVIPTLSWWWGLSAPETLRAILAVA